MFGPFGLPCVQFAAGPKRSCVSHVSQVSFIDSLWRLLQALLHPVDLALACSVDASLRFSVELLINGILTVLI